MDDARIITKYPNRRLYDTAESRYVALADVHRLVLDNVEFSVVDKKTGEDITRNILLQIIMEEEANGEPIFSVAILRRIIRFYGDILQGLVSDYLDNSLGLLVEQQKRYELQMEKAVKANPLITASELAKYNLELWRSLQSELFKTASKTGAASVGSDAAGELKEAASNGAASRVDRRTP